jgi:hypothetical protein
MLCLHLGNYAFQAIFKSNFLCFEDKSQAIGMANIYLGCKWTKGELDLHVTRFPLDNSQTWQQAHLCGCLESSIHIK